jgi:hypothetical protein
MNTRGSPIKLDQDAPVNLQEFAVRRFIAAIARDI